MPKLQSKAKIDLRYFSGKWALIPDTTLVVIPGQYLIPQVSYPEKQATIYWYRDAIQIRFRWLPGRYVLGDTRVFQNPIPCQNRK
jgi:hypothetical protein